MEEELQFELLTSPGPLSKKELTDDVELWIVRISPQVAVEELAGRKLPLTDGRTERTEGLEITSETFVPAGLHVLLPNKKGKKLRPVSLRVAGQVAIHRRLDVPTSDVTYSPLTSRPPEAPPQRTDRHPMLGVGYKKTLRRNKRALEISKRCDLIESTPQKSSKKKRKRSDAAVIEQDASGRKSKKLKW